MNEGVDSVLTGNARGCIVEGDCRDVLKQLGDKSVAATIMDPQYDGEAHTAARRQRSNGKVGLAPLPFEPMTEPLRQDVAGHAIRLSQAWVVAFCQAEGVLLWKRALGAAYYGPMVWVKPDGPPNYMGDGPGMGFESLVTAWCGTGKSKWNGGGRRGVLTHNVGVFGGEKNWHPTQKPLLLMRELITLFTNKGDVILDPFCGSGSTGVAALQLGRRFIGIERRSDYANVARGRLAAELDGISYRDVLCGQTSLYAYVRDREV